MTQLQVICLLVQPKTFTDREKKTPINLYQVNFVNIENNEFLSFYLQDTEYINKFTKLKAQNLTAKDLKPITINVDLVATGKNNEFKRKLISMA